MLRNLVISPNPRLPFLFATSPDGTFSKYSRRCEFLLTNNFRVGHYKGWIIMGYWGFFKDTLRNALHPKPETVDSNL